VGASLRWRISMRVADAGLAPEGARPLGRTVAESRPGVYLVSLSRSSRSSGETVTIASLSALTSGSTSCPEAPSCRRHGTRKFPADPAQRLWRLELAENTRRASIAPLGPSTSSAEARNGSAV
jgi:hypothetical protein